MAETIPKMIMAFFMLTEAGGLRARATSVLRRARVGHGGAEGQSHRQQVAAAADGGGEPGLG